MTDSNQPLSPGHDEVTLKSHYISMHPNDIPLHQRKDLNIENIENGINTILSSHDVDSFRQDDRDQLTNLTNLATYSYDQYDATRDIEHLNETIQALQKAHDITPMPSEHRYGILNNLRQYLTERFDKMNEVCDLEEAIQVGRDAIDPLLGNASDRPISINKLGMLLSIRYNLLGDISDIDNAIDMAREAIGSVSMESIYRSGLLSSLRELLCRRYSKTASACDIDEAIHVAQEAADSLPEGNPHKSMFLIQTGGALSKRYFNTGIEADFKAALEIFRGVIQTCPEWHPDLPSCWIHIADLIDSRYARTDALEDLNIAIVSGFQALSVMSEEHTQWTQILDQQSRRLGDRYERVGDEKDIEEALNMAQIAIRASKDNLPQRPLYIYSLGCLLRVKYLKSGSMTDLLEAIREGQRAVLEAYEQELNYPTFLSLVGTLLEDRYSVTGAVHDLDEAIRLSREAVNASPRNSQDRGLILHNLSNRLRQRYERTKAGSHLEEAIQAARDAIETTPEGNPDRPNFLNSLSCQLSERYQQKGSISDLEESICHNRESIKTVPRDHLKRVMFMNNLCHHLLLRYKKTDETANLEEATSLAREVVRDAPQDDQRLSGYLINLGLCLEERYNKTRRRQDCEEAASYNERAMNFSNAPIIARIQAGVQALRSYAELREWQRAYDAGSQAIGLIPELMTRSLDTGDKQQLLGRLKNVACDAAAAALMANKGAMVALNLLEQGRGLLAASIDDMRADVQQLREEHPNLAERYLVLRSQVGPLASNGIDKVIDRQAPLNQRYEAGKELDELVLEIRAKAGFEAFLLAPSEDEIKNASRSGPIVVINDSAIRYDAIIVQPDEIRVVHLPNIDPDEVLEKAKRHDLGAPDILEWLWDTVAGPVMTALRFTGPAAPDNCPRVWWIPTGHIGIFAIHAAGRHRECSGKTVLDRVMSSYSSTIKTILRSRQQPTNSTVTQAVLVAMEHTPGNFHLPYAKKEVDALRQLCLSMGLDPVDPKKEKKYVLDVLSQCRVFHFAGHGHTNPTQPSKSHLLLENNDGDSLSVSDLLQINLYKTQPLLAYLSACGTGRIKTMELFNESVHLISACQIAGFRHVIGTLWDVNDESCEDVARITYETIRNEGMTDKSICLGLHLATRTLRDRWLSSLKTENSVSWTRMDDIKSRPSENGAEAVGDGHIKGSREPRNVEICEDGKSEAPHWVPYVHYGV